MKIFNLMLCLTALAIFASCAKSDVDQVADERFILSDLKINTTAELPLLIGKDSLLNLSKGPGNASNSELVWESSDPEVATVDAAGRVKAIALGTATIKVSSTDGGGRVSSIVLQVIDHIDYITEIKLTAASTELFEDEILEPVVSVLPVNATYQTLKWTSSDPSIATVSETGTVTAIKHGTVTITATSTDGENKSGTIELTIKEVIPLTGIAISTVIDETMAIDQLLPVQVMLTPSNATAQSLEWSSDDETVATVSNAGVITGKGDGRATITVSAKNDKSIQASINVIVEAGKIDDIFIDGVPSRWIASTAGASAVVQNNILWMTMSNAAGPGNRRGDFRRTNTTLHVGNYPIIAFKFTRPLPTGGNVFFDTNQGRWKNGANNMTALTGKDGVQVLYADMGTSNTFGGTGFTLPTTSAYTFTQISVGVADMPWAQNPMSPYPIYWIKTFKTVADLEAYIKK